MNGIAFNADVIEASLAHNDKNEIRRIYNRSIYSDKRIVLMDWWGCLFVNLTEKHSNNCLNKHGFITSFFVLNKYYL